MPSQTDLLTDVWNRLDESYERERKLQQDLYLKSNSLEAVGILAVAASLLATFELVIIIFRVF